MSVLSDIRTVHLSWKHTSKWGSKAGFTSYVLEIIVKNEVLVDYDRPIMQSTRSVSSRQALLIYFFHTLRPHGVTQVLVSDALSGEMLDGDALS